MIHNERLLWKAGFWTFVLLLLNSSAFAATPKVGEVVAVTGKAWVIRKAVKTDLVAKSEIRNEDILATGESSTLTLLLGKKEAALFVKPNTEVQVKHSQGNTWLVELNKGMLATHVRPKPTHKNYFRVRTKTAVMGVRGTDFFIKYEEGKDLFLCTCFGRISVDDKIILTSKHHDVPKTIKAGNAPLESRMIPSEQGDDHSDDGALMLTRLTES